MGCCLLGPPVLQGFAGLTTAEPAVRGAVLDFAYHLALGAQEEAFRAVAALNSPAVWRTMAHAAIKNKRLDVAGGQGAGGGRSGCGTGTSSVALGSTLSWGSLLLLQTATPR
jgi:hypothetical protein